MCYLDSHAVGVGAEGCSGGTGVGYGARAGLRNVDHRQRNVQLSAGHLPNTDTLTGGGAGL